MDFPTGQTGRDGWDPAPAAAVCVCAACASVQCAQHHLSSPPRAGAFGSGDALNCLSSLGIFFFLFCLSSYTKFASGGGGRWGVA